MTTWTAWFSNEARSKAAKRAISSWKLLLDGHGPPGRHKLWTGGKHMENMGISSLKFVSFRPLVLSRIRVVITCGRCLHQVTLQVFESQS